MFGFVTSYFEIKQYIVYVMTTKCEALYIILISFLFSKLIDIPRFEKRFTIALMQNFSRGFLKILLYGKNEHIWSSSDRISILFKHALRICDPAVA